MKLSHTVIPIFLYAVISIMIQVNDFISITIQLKVNKLYNKAVKNIIYITIHFKNYNFYNDNLKRT